jgi:hypothetical protein
VKNGAVRVEDALRYALSLPVATVVSGIDSLEVLRQNVAIARGFTAMPAAEMAALRERLAPLAADGRFELYKTSKHYDGGIGRGQHGFPSRGEIGA